MDGRHLVLLETASPLNVSHVDALGIDIASVDALLKGICAYAKQIAASVVKAAGDFKVVRGSLVNGAVARVALAGQLGVVEPPPLPLVTSLAVQTQSLAWASSALFFR